MCSFINTHTHTQNVFYLKTGFFPHHFIRIYLLYRRDSLWQLWIDLHCTLVRLPSLSPLPPTLTQPHLRQKQSSVIFSYLLDGSQFKFLSFSNDINCMLTISFSLQHIQQQSQVLKSNMQMNQMVPQVNAVFCDDITLSSLCFSFPNIHGKFRKTLVCLGCRASLNEPNSMRCGYSIHLMHSFFGDGSWQRVLIYTECLDFLLPGKPCPGQFDQFHQRTGVDSEHGVENWFWESACLWGIGWPPIPTHLGCRRVISDVGCLSICLVIKCERNCKAQREASSDQLCKGWNAWGRIW
jgi:hypothetical protein